ncbi:transglycosylase domain-containing protein [Halocynthiibacter sp.]|uniref:transglycosylase domain-containing protein n=1 Tax=Halocynthiibacter sp. TaxID=1979210 RepID=UPI003C484CD3
MSGKNTRGTGNSTGGRKRIVAERRYPSGGAAKPAAKKRTVKKPAARKATRRKSNTPRGPIRRLLGLIMLPFIWIFRLIWKITWRASLVGALILAAAVFYVSSTLPDDYRVLVDQRARGSVTLLDREGQVFAWRGDQFGGMITAGTVSAHLHNAVVATEDKRFYGHFGVSPRGIASAIRINLRSGRGALSGNGGSTITQQTAKLLCLGVPYDPSAWESERAYEADCRRGSLWRKAKEAIYALALEVSYSKEEVLTIYMNRAFLGAGARGFEAASQRYFGKSANEVNPAEAAMLAGLLKAPSRYAPTNNLQRARDRGETVLKLMNDQGYLTDTQHAQAIENPATLSRAAAAEAGGYFADWVMRSGPEIFTRNTTEDVIIRTSFDQDIQSATEEAMQLVFQERVSAGSTAQAAIVVMSADGAVRAMVGGRDVRASGAFNRAVQAQRQTGSAFKPFVYGAAMELGYTPNDYVVDAELCLDIPGSSRYCPRNYTNQFYGNVTLTEALAKSLNTAAVRISEAMGRENVRKIANDFGLESDLALGPALALGASESTLLEMTGAYAGILNGGSAVTPYGLVELSLQGESEPVITQEGGIGERVISRRAAQDLTWMMSRVVAEGTGARAQLPGWQVAGKTGTTQGAKDAWFIGFTADYVVGVWMGNDDNKPLRGVTGGGLPATIWQEVMARITANMTPRPLPMTNPGPAQPLISQEELQRQAAEEARRQQRAQRQQQRRDRTDGVINNLLNGLFGGN